MIINSKLSACKIRVNHEKQVDVVKGSNFYYLVDVSVSMSGELQKIRTQLKNKLATLLKDEDRISIIWFSGDNQAGILQENVQVTNLSQLSKLHEAIDKFLKPIGATAFRKPLDLVYEIIERTKSSNPNALIFMTDGYNNDCKWSDVLTSLKRLEPFITSTTFVEYGYYADSKKLGEMAELSGGDKITASNFESYDLTLSKKLSTPIVSSKKTLVEIKDVPYKDIAFARTVDNDIVVFNTSNPILVNSTVNEVIYLTEKQDNQDISETDLYVAVQVFANKLMVDETEALLNKIGDVQLIDEYSVAYGKQKLFKFLDNVRESINNDKNRFKEGKATTPIIIDENRYCLLDLINDLQAANAKFYPFHELFNYNKISKAAGKQAITLSDEDKKLLTEATVLSDVESLIESLKEKNKPLKFEILNKSKGYSMNDLVYNESRANLSVRVKVDGYVKLPENDFALDKAETFIYRTFNIVCDGIVNVDNIIVSIDGDVPTNLLKYCSKTNELNIYSINIKDIPLINKKMCNELSAVELAKIDYELMRLKAQNKVFKTEKDTKNYGLADIYGEDAAAWLSTIGFSDVSGFAPKTESVESTDNYMAVELKVKIKGLSSLPKIEDVVNKLVKNNNETTKLTISENLIHGALNELEQVKKLTTDVGEINTKLADELISTKIKNLNKKKRELSTNKAKQIFTLVASRKWFKEFESYDDNKLVVNLDGKDTEVVFEYKEVPVSL